MTDCHIDIANSGGMRGVPCALVGGFFGKGPGRNRLSCDPSVPPVLVERNDDPDFAEMLWDAAGYGWYNATYHVKDRKFGECLWNGWHPSQQDLSDAMQHRYACDGQSWLSVHYGTAPDASRPS